MNKWIKKHIPGEILEIKEDNEKYIVKAKIGEIIITVYLMKEEIIKKICKWERKNG